MPSLSGYIRTALCGIFVFVLITGKLQAESYPDSAYRFQPRVEAKIRTSRSRTLAATEIWAPLAQENGRIIYGSVRYMGDNNQNFEGNIGLGYRQLAFSKSKWLPQQILGVHGWLDRRHTSFNTTLYQAVIGGEVMGKDYDFRVNAYFPLSGSREFKTANFGSDKPYIAGHGIYYDTNGFAVEEAQSGYDIEFGRRVPILTKYVDSIRAYNGVYRFSGNKTDNILGARTRFEINITPSFTIGGRAQYDHMRGIQGFTELTLRFPFSAKKPYSSKDLRSRLDESPERDIDIVTNTALLDDGLMKPVINTETGEAQRIIHVDNRYASNGTGAAHHPFQSLVEAQDAMRPNDIVYIHYGDGTSGYLDNGFVISQPDIKVIGAEQSLVYGNGQLFSRHHNDTGFGDILIQGTQAPVIRNSNTNNAFGHGILVTADNVSITGLRIEQSIGNGIHIMADGQSVNNVSITDVSSTANYGSGIGIEAMNGGTVDNIKVTKSIFNRNLRNGINVISSGSNSQISSLLIGDNQADHNNGNGWNGIFYGGKVFDTVIRDNSFNQNHLSGFELHAAGQSDIRAELSGNAITENHYRGLSLETRDSAALNFKAEENTITDTLTYMYSSTGLHIDHDSTNPVFNIDLGGGSLGSKGHNRIFNNGNYELYLDSRPGDITSNDGKVVSARFNYWGTDWFQSLQQNNPG